MIRRAPRSALLSSALLVWFARFESDSAGVAVAVLSKAPGALIVAVTLMVVLAPEASEGMVHGRAPQPLPLTVAVVRFVGVSVTWMLVAGDRPGLGPHTEVAD